MPHVKQFDKKMKKRLAQPDLRLPAWMTGSEKSFPPREQNGYPGRGEFPAIVAEAWNRLEAAGHVPKPLLGVLP